MRSLGRIFAFCHFLLKKKRKVTPKKINTLIKALFSLGLTFSFGIKYIILQFVCHNIADFIEMLVDLF